MPKSTILLLHGPNFNMLGLREPEIYGENTLEDIHDACDALSKDLGFTLETFQSNHEGALLDTIHEAYGRVDGVIINPGALTHTSVALRDALAILECPIVEVHLSNVYKREEFRHHSFISAVATATLSGCGPHGYLLALQALDMMLNDE